MMEDTLHTVLQQHRHNFADVLSFSLQEVQLCYLDLSDQNKDLSISDIADNSVFAQYIRQYIRQHQADVAIGQYKEDRSIYKKSSHFTPQGQEARSIHLGVDLWLSAGTSIHAPLQGTVHSFQNNNNYGDYGPTIILEHQLESITFYTLYGHLSLSSLSNISQGQQISQGESFCELGAPQENGQWPPHLHFQLIRDMMHKQGDFPGVAKPSEQEKYLHLCPDPALILGIPTHLKA
ncbi:MAG: peptidoglycan DD-metalloendopeptidase family protein [Bacteroidales bacterium]